MKERVWHKGPPPHIGWWNASLNRSWHIWRWWDGENWSTGIRPDCSEQALLRLLNIRSGFSTPEMEWTDYYPDSARVARIDPRKGAAS
jgi:hypothetical protein